MSMYAMWLRQIKKYWRAKARMVGSLGQPLLFLLVFGFGFGSIFEKAVGTNYISFLVPGIIGMGIIFTAVFTGIEVIWDRQFGFLKETLVAPVSRFNIFMGRTLGGATVATIQGIVVLLISFLIGFRPASILYIPIAILFMFLIALMFTALGTAIASNMQDMQAFPLIMNFIIMPLFFLSGALFPFSSAPKTLQIIANINPLSYAVDGLRDALTGISNLGLALDFQVTILVTIVLVVIGSYLFSKIEI